MIPDRTYTAPYTTFVSATTTGSGSTEIVSSALATYSLQGTPAPYTFRADAKDNVAVYYGQSPNTTAGGLLELCEHEDVDIVIISFLMTFFGPQDYPAINFSPACDPLNAAQQEKAPGLEDCSRLAAEVAGCQQIGKKVLVSLGGYLANTSFVSDDQATQFATTLWNLFGAGSDDTDLRPFGRDVVIDGFDIDNENHNITFYTTFATALRQKFTQDASKTYCLSAAPQCPIPDASIAMGAMQQADFVWVQFYNNPFCNLNETGFLSSFAAWARQLSSNSTTATGPMVYIGAAASEGAGSGYVPGAEFADYVGQARQLGNVSNLGGVMLWDGSAGLTNVDQSGSGYLDYAKAALQ